MQSREELLKREQMTEQEGRELRGEKHLKSLPVSLTLADSIGRAHISPYSRYCFVHEQKTFMKIYVDPITYSFIHTHVHLYNYKTENCFAHNIIALYHFTILYYCMCIYHVHM